MECDLLFMPVIMSLILLLVVSPMFRLSNAQQDNVLRWLRSCATCGSSLPPIDLMCSPCWARFGKIHRDHLFHLGGKVRSTPFPTFALANWSEQQTDFVSKLVHGFKGGRDLRAARRLAQLLVDARRQDAPLPKDVLLVPAPGGRHNHARALALEIGEILHAPVLDILIDPKKRKVSSNQKSQALEGRFERKYEVRAPEVDLKAHIFERPTWIFIDDVITSGATAMAAYMALGDPTCFEVWTLANRPLLAAKEGLC